MKFFLQNKQKISHFDTILSILKSFNEVINVQIKDSNIFYIQAMDKSHVCLCECKLTFDWFDMIETSDETISFTISTAIFQSIINAIYKENMGFVLEINSIEDNIKINTFNDKIKSANNIDTIEQQPITTNKKDSHSIKFDKYFVIPLLNEQQESLEISDTDYNVEFDINTKILLDILHQISLFGNILKISCTEDTITFLSSKDSNGEMTAVIKTDDLELFSIDEGLELEIDYSLSYLTKYCITQKLTENVNINISSEYPAKVKYDLSNDSSISFYIAPKISEE